MDKGTVVYLCWYDFAKKCENVYQGEVVDNDLWADTQWAGWVNVQFTPMGLAKPICHHFRKEQLSLDAQNVPHDDCYLVCGKKKLEPQREHKVEYESVSLEDFKRLHWDQERNHLQVDSLEEFYRLWCHRAAIRAGMQRAAKEMTYPVIRQECPSTPAEAMQPQRRIVSDEKMEELKEQLKSTLDNRSEFKKTVSMKVSKKMLRSTGQQNFGNVTQLSLFD